MAASGARAKGGRDVHGEGGFLGGRGGRRWWLVVGMGAAAAAPRGRTQRAARHRVLRAERAGMPVGVGGVLPRAALCGGRPLILGADAGVVCACVDRGGRHTLHGRVAAHPPAHPPPTSAAALRGVGAIGAGGGLPGRPPPPVVDSPPPLRSRLAVGGARRTGAGGATGR